MATRYSVQERTENTAWRTESTYKTEREAVIACQEMCRREPTNEAGEAVEYRVTEA